MGGRKRNIPEGGWTFVPCGALSQHRSYVGEDRYQTRQRTSVMEFLYVKALHIIFVVTWFSGMFYLCRLFIYNREAQDRPEAERAVLQPQFNLMIRRLLFGITWPSAILTIIFGVWLLIMY